MGCCKWDRISFWWTRQPRWCCRLMNGLPSLGKSALVADLQHLIGWNKWNTIKFNGTECKEEMIHEIVQQLACTSLFGDWQMLWMIRPTPSRPWHRYAFSHCWMIFLAGLPSPARATASSVISRNVFKRALKPLKSRHPPPRKSSHSYAVTCPMNRRSSMPPTFVDGNVRQALLDAKGLVQRS